MKNLRVRKAMLEAGMRQQDLANLVGKSRSYVSILLSSELTKSEQDALVRAIRERGNGDVERETEE